MNYGRVHFAGSFTGIARPSLSDVIFDWNWFRVWGRLNSVLRHRNLGGHVQLYFSHLTNLQLMFNFIYLGGVTGNFLSHSTTRPMLLHLFNRVYSCNSDVISFRIFLWSKMNFDLLLCVQFWFFETLWMFQFFFLLFLLFPLEFIPQDLLFWCGANFFFLVLQDFPVSFFYSSYFLS